MRGKTTTRKLTSLAVVGGLLFAACGRDDDDAEDPAPVETTAPATGQDGTGTTAQTEGTAEPEPEDPTTSAEETEGEAPQAEPAQGFTDSSINICQTAPLSGPLSVGAAVPAGAAAYFNYVNEELGGVTMADGKTRTIDFNVADDQYDPARTVEAFKRFFEQDDCTIGFGPMGTAPSKAIRAYVNENNYPTVLISSGAGFWSAEADEFPWTMTFPLAYTTEAAILGKYLQSVNPDAKLAILYQNDEVGADYRAGMAQGIEGSNVEIVAEQAFDANSATVDSQMTQLAASDADTLFIIGTSKPAAQALRRTAELGWDPLILAMQPALNLQSVFEPAGIENSIGVVGTQFVKDPLDATWADDPGMVEYRRIVEEYGDGADADSALTVQGFTMAEILVASLENISDPSPEGILATLSSVSLAPSMFLPGIEAGVNAPDDVHMIDQAQIVEFDGERLVPIGEVLGAG